ncbi:NADH-ubiquinone oxidoreductase chain 6 [Bienertia sinuspersici]
MILSVLSSPALVSGLMVVRAKNPVHSVLFPIPVFRNTSGLLLLLGLDFSAMIFPVVYIGAIAVSFLFVVMMFHIQIAEIHEEVLRYLPVSGIIGLIFWWEMFFILDNETIPLLPTQRNTTSLRYTVYAGKKDYNEEDDRPTHDLLKVSEIDWFESNSLSAVIPCLTKAFNGNGFYPEPGAGEDMQLSFSSMSPVPTHWDPKHTDLRDAFHTVHCRHFNLALDSSRLLVIDYRSALQVQRFPHKAKDRPHGMRTVVTIGRSKSYPAQLIRTTRQRESHSIINSQKAAKRNLTGRPLRGKERKSLSAHNDCRVFSGWREGRKKEKTNTKVHGILKKKEDRERGTDFPSINPYLYIPWQQTEGSFVVVVNSRPIPVPKKIHEKTTMISERTERESRLVVDKFYDPVICKYVSSAALPATATQKAISGMGRKVDRQPTELGNAGLGIEDESSSQQRASIYRAPSLSVEDVVVTLAASSRAGHPAVPHQAAGIAKCSAIKANGALYFHFLLKVNSRHCKQIESPRPFEVVASQKAYRQFESLT